MVVDAEAITNLDYTAARVVRDLHQELMELGVTLAFATVGPYLQADFDRHHITEVIGTDHIYQRLHDALEAFAKLGSAPQISNLNAKGDAHGTLACISHTV